MNKFENGEWYKKIIFNIFLAAIGIIGSVCSFCAYLYTLEFDMQLIILTGVSLSVLFSFLFSYDKIRKFVIFIALAVFVFLIFTLFGILRDGFAVWFDSFKFCAKESQYTIPIDYFDISSVSDTEFCSTIFIMMLEYFVALLVTFSLSRRKGLISSLIIVFALSIMGIIVDLQPNLIFFGMTFAYAFGVISIKLSSQIGAYRQYKQAFMIGAAIFILSSTVAYILPGNASIRNANTERLKKFLEDELPNLIAGNLPKKVRGGMDHGNLMSYKYGMHYDGKTDLIVTLPYDSRNVYLKSYTAKDYYDGKWTNENMEPFEYKTLNPEMLTGYAANNFAINPELLHVPKEVIEPYIYSYDITIKKTFDTGDEVFVPYYSIPTGNIYEFTEEDMRKLTNAESYTLKSYVLSEFEDFDVYGDSGFLHFGAYEGVSKDNIRYDIWQYYDYVKQHYTYSFMLYDMIVKAKYGERTIRYDEDIIALIDDIKKDFNENYTYSLELSDPGDKDPIEYFLEDSHEGFCMHFATAATLILRSYGIPARYAEGYMVRPNDKRWGKIDGYCTYLNGEKAYNMTTVNVSDKLAHAWVEIYYSGTGWVPVEFTPGFSQSDVNIVKPTKDPTKASKEPTTKHEVTTKQKKSIENVTATKEVMNKEIHEEKKYNPYWLILFMIEFLLIMSIVILHYVALEHNKKVLDKKGPVDKDRAVKIYKTLDKLLFYLKYDKKPEMSYVEFAERLKELDCAKDVDVMCVMRLVTEAFFGREQLVTDEKLISDAIDSIKKLSVNAYNSMGILQKFRFRYIINIYYK